MLRYNDLRFSLSLSFAHPTKLLKPLIKLQICSFKKTNKQKKTTQHWNNWIYSSCGQTPKICSVDSTGSTFKLNWVEKNSDDGKAHLSSFSWFCYFSRRQSKKLARKPTKVGYVRGAYTHPAPTDRGLLYSYMNRGTVCGRSHGGCSNTRFCSYLSWNSSRLVDNNKQPLCLRILGLNGAMFPSWNDNLKMLVRSLSDPTCVCVCVPMWPDALIKKVKSTAKTANRHFVISLTDQFEVNTDCTV